MIVDLDLLNSLPLPQLPLIIHLETQPIPVRARLIVLQRGNHVYILEIYQWHHIPLTPLSYLRGTL